jgi:hypothetical protein
MAFAATGFDVNGSGSKGVPGIHKYQSADALATIEASGYFDSMATLIPTGTTIIIDSTASTGGGQAICRMVNTANVITVGTKTTLS